ncbi:MAG: ABC transporter ATP-binding protein [Bryobacteraceae bacterium]
MIVTVDNITHRYGSRVALSAVSLAVKPGEIFGLLGPNGGGKSTLFRILSTLMAPTEGRAEICGYDVDRDPGAVRRSIGVVFQTQSLDKKLTVEENLRGQGHLHGISGSRLRDRIDNVYKRLGLAERRKDLVEVLSGGLRQRVEIAKGLLHQPKVLLMDEASTGLDPGARRDLWQYILELRNQEGVTILLTSHILDEADRCDRLALLHEGRVVAEGSPAELKRRIGGDVVVLETADPAALGNQIESRFRLRPQTVDNTLRIEIQNGHRFITDLVEAFPGAIDSVALHKPTLEDVFLRETGATL